MTGGAVTEAFFKFIRERWRDSMQSWSKGFKKEIKYRVIIIESSAFGVAVSRLSRRNASR